MESVRGGAGREQDRHGDRAEAGLASCELAGDEGISGPVSVLGVAGYQGPLRAVRIGSWLGRRAAGVYHAGVHRGIRKVGQDWLRWYSLSDLQFGGFGAVDVFLELHQHGGGDFNSAQQYDFEGVFSAFDSAFVQRVGQVAGFFDSDDDFDRVHVCVSDYADRVDSVSAGIFGII